MKVCASDEAWDASALANKEGSVVEGDGKVEDEDDDGCVDVDVFADDSRTRSVGFG